MTTPSEPALTQTEPPQAPLRTESFRKARPEIVGPESPEAPFPIYMSGAVQKGFGRGGKDLGCPTGMLRVSLNTCQIADSREHSIANLPDEALESMASVTTTGIYYGYARVHPEVEESGKTGDCKGEDLETYPMVMSLGWNPFYKNEKMTAVLISLRFLVKLLNPVIFSLGSPHNA